MDLVPNRGLEREISRAPRWHPLLCGRQGQAKRKLKGALRSSKEGRGSPSPASLSGHSSGSGERSWKMILFAPRALAPFRARLSSALAIFWRWVLGAISKLTSPLPSPSPLARRLLASLPKGSGGKPQENSPFYCHFLLSKPNQSVGGEDLTLETFHSVGPPATGARKAIY